MSPSGTLIQRLSQLPPEERRRLLEATAEFAASDYDSDEVREWLEFDDPIEPDEPQEEMLG